MGIQDFVQIFYQLKPQVLKIVIIRIFDTKIVYNVEQVPLKRSIIESVS